MRIRIDTEKLIEVIAEVVITILFPIGFILGLSWLLFGCITTSHKASKYMVKHPVVGATYCEVYHPCKDSVSVLTKYMEGELRIDTIDNSHTDTFTNYSTSTRTLIKYRTVVKIKTDTVTSIRTIYQTDKSNVELLRNAKELIVAKDSAIHKRNTWVFGLALSWLLFILGWLVRSLIINRLNRG